MYAKSLTGSGVEYVPAKVVTAKIENSILTIKIRTFEGGTINSKDGIVLRIPAVKRKSIDEPPTLENVEIPENEKLEKVFAQWKVVDGVIHFQVRVPFQYNREYGMAFDVKPSKSLYRKYEEYFKNYGKEESK